MSLNWTIKSFIETLEQNNIHIISGIYDRKGRLLFCHLWSLNMLTNQSKDMQHSNHLRFKIFASNPFISTISIQEGSLDVDQKKNAQTKEINDIPSS